TWSPASSIAQGKTRGMVGGLLTNDEGKHLRSMHPILLHHDKMFPLADLDESLARAAREFVRVISESRMAACAMVPRSNISRLAFISLKFVRRVSDEHHASLD